MRLTSQRLEELEGLRRAGQLLDVQGSKTLGEYVEHHVDRKAREGTSERHVALVRLHLQTAVEYFGDSRDLASIQPKEIAEWVGALKARSNGRGGTLTNATARKYLNAMSDLFNRAVSDGATKTNPARDLYSASKPKPERVEARYWDPHEVAALLESAQTLLAHAPIGGRGGGGVLRADAYPWIYPLLATAALTGARKSELFGLEVDDVSFKYKRIFIRPNGWRTLKTRGSERDVPLWPQLEGILRDYIAEREQSGGIGALLFPSHRHEDERMLDNVDRQLDRIGERAGIHKPRLQAFRHSYTAARLQTLEHGAPVSVWQVARELGHRSTQMIDDRYGHLARVTERTEVVEFIIRPEHEKESAPTVV
ncbi:MAG: tyrosine-type recombinase/integrase [Gemmatimonadetes bacterium]|nr:tyrosine-type recombinase/integrase [Gemmatimonadota bacterium]